MTVALLSLSFLVLLVLPQEQTRPVFRASTEVVQVDVFVGKGGKAVPGLGREAFSLYDDGEKQDIEVVDVTTVPLDVAIVFDTSRSVAGTKLLNLQIGVHAFIDGLEKKDRAALISFSQHLSFRAALTSDRAELHDAVDSVSPFGATAWHDALYAGLKIVEGPTHRPIVLLFGDGNDTYSFLRKEQLLPLVEHSDAVFYAITPAERRRGPGTAFSTERERWRSSHEQRSRRTKLLRTLTEASGGRLMEAESVDRLQQTFLELLAEMKTRYLLTFEPPHPIRQGWHDIEVEVNVRGAEACETGLLLRINDCGGRGSRLYQRGLFARALANSYAE